MKKRVIVFSAMLIQRLLQTVANIIILAFTHFSLISAYLSQDIFHFHFISKVGSIHLLMFFNANFDSNKTCEKVLT